MADTLSVLTYLRENKERFMKKYHLTLIGVSGSFARGEQKSSSDIDLLIDFEPDTEDLYSLKIKLKDEVQYVFNRKVDLCRIKYIKPIFLDQILSDAKYV